MTSLKTVVVDADETVVLVYRRISPELDTLQRLVGGYIEVVCGAGWTAYVNEEGKIDGLPVNVRATQIARTLGWNTGDVLNGTVVFLGPADEEGEDTDVTATVTDAVTRLGYPLTQLR